MDFYNLLEEDQKALENTSATTEFFEDHALWFWRCEGKTNEGYEVTYEGVELNFPLLDMSRYQHTDFFTIGIDLNLLEFLFDHELIDPTMRCNGLSLIGINKYQDRPIEYFQFLLGKGTKCAPDDFLNMCRYRSERTVKFFLDLGQDPNLMCLDGYLPQSPLINAARNMNFDRYEIVKTLLDHGADPELKLKGDRTIDLILVHGSPDERLVKLALELGADPNFRYREDPTCTPLSIELLGNDSVPNIESCILLVQAGAQFNELYPSDEWIDEYDIEESTFLGMFFGLYEISSELGEIEVEDIVRFLRTMLTKDRTITNKPDSRGRTPLRYIVEHVDSLNIQCEFAKILLEFDADPNIPDNKGKTPIEIARNYGNSRLVSLLQEV